MPYIERTDEEIIEALMRYLERFSQDETVLCVGGKSYTRRMLIEELQKKSGYMYESFVSFSKKTAKIHDLDPLVLIQEHIKNDQ